MRKSGWQSLAITALIGRFEDKPTSDHFRTAIGWLQRVREEVRFPEEDRARKWHDECEELIRFINQGLAPYRQRGEGGLIDALRKFTQDFEHAERRALQLMVGMMAQDERDRIMDLLSLAYRLSVYAILSYWIDDKRDRVEGYTKINVTTGETTQELSYTPMKVPKKHRHARKNL